MAGRGRVGPASAFLPLLLAVGLLLSACAGSESSAVEERGEGESAASPYDLFPRAPPAEVGLSSEGASALVDTVEAWIEADEIVGAVLLLVHRGRTVLHRAVGMADRERAIPMRTDHVVRMRSMTKPLVGTAVLMLVEEGHLSLDDPVAAHLPSFDTPHARGITVFHLLTHTSGLTGSIYATAEGTPFPTLRAAVDSVARRGPTFEPGTDYAYSDPGTSTLGALVAEVSGLHVEHFITRRILEPLEMRDAFLFLSLDHPLRDRVASTYRTPESDTAGTRWVKYWDNTMPQVMPFFRASGGLYATAADYARFLGAMKNGGRLGEVRLLEEETVERATRPHADGVFEPDTPEAIYGLHWTVFTERAAPESRGAFGHGGSDGTYAWVDPKRDLIAVYLTQSRSNETRTRFRELVYRLLLEESGSL